MLLVLCVSLAISMIDTNAEKLTEIVKDKISCPSGLEQIPGTGALIYCYGLFVPSEGPMNYSQSLDFCNQFNESILVAFMGKASVFICQSTRTTIASRT